MSLKPGDEVRVTYTMTFTGTFEVLNDDLQDPQKGDEQVVREIVNEVGLHDWKTVELNDVSYERV